MCNTTCQRHDILVTPHETKGVSAVWAKIQKCDIKKAETPKNFRFFVILGVAKADSQQPKANSSYF